MDLLFTDCLRKLVKTLLKLNGALPCNLSKFVKLRACIEANRVARLSSAFDFFDTRTLVGSEASEQFEVLLAPSRYQLDLNEGISWFEAHTDSLCLLLVPLGVLDKKKSCASSALIC